MNRIAETSFFKIEGGGVLMWVRSYDLFREWQIFQISSIVMVVATGHGPSEVSHVGITGFDKPEISEMISM